MRNTGWEKEPRARGVMSWAAAGLMFAATVGIAVTTAALRVEATFVRSRMERLELEVLALRIELARREMTIAQEDRPDVLARELRAWRTRAAAPERVERWRAER